MNAPLFSLLAAVLLLLPNAARAQTTTDPAIEAKIDALMKKMTLDEKLGQLHQLREDELRENGTSFNLVLVHDGQVGSVLGMKGAADINAVQRAALEGSRLKIPILFGFDVIHGYRTVFPIPLAEAASWNPAAAERSSAVAAAEASAAGIKWTFAPMVDITRDPRWGRIAEGAGEDPYLGAAMARARVMGFQGSGPIAFDRVLACAKHWVGYGAVEGGRDYNSTDISERTLREIYFPPFKAAVDAGVGTLMSAYNDLNGVPASANHFTLTQVLRDEWGFNGFVVSDYKALEELIEQGIARDRSEASLRALLAGVDMDMGNDQYVKDARALILDGKLDVKTLDQATRRVLREKFRLGLFEHPYADEAREKTAFLKPEYVQLAKENALSAIVLLKNENGALPLGPSVKTIALVGPLADDAPDVLGTWSGVGQPADAVTLRAALEKAAPSGTRILYAKGCEVGSGTSDGIAAAVQAAKQADVVIAAVGESADMNGEASSRSDISLPGAQLELVQAVAASGKPVVVVLMNGRPLTIPWIAEHVPAILEAWHGGVQAGPAIAETLFGAANPGGKLPVTFPRSVGQVPFYYDHMNTGRPGPLDDIGGTKYISRYIDLPNDPQYPFGWGLSYTTFALSGLTLSTPKIPASGTVIATVTVENTGKRKGDEVVQLYIHRPVASATRPVRELKGFKRVTLDPGGKTTVSFPLGPDELTYLDAGMRPAIEPGTFEVYAGSSSIGGLEASFEITAPAR